MSVFQNDIFIRALLRQPVPMTPIWVMRQAGRYLASYRQTRARAGDFLTLCKTPELACEVTLQPVEQFPLDAAIIFSDILTIPDAMGLGLYFKTAEGPWFKTPLRTEQQIKQLVKPHIVSQLDYVMSAIKLVKRSLANRIPLIGFSGSPWTLACYMIEGGGSRDFATVKAMMYQRPDLLHHLLSILTEAVVDYLQAQIVAGVDAVMVFDSWGGILTPPCYQEFSLQNLKHIVKKLKLTRDQQQIPSIVFSKGVHHALADLAESGYDAMGLDWTCDLATVRRITADKIALQGNLDPGVLYGSPTVIQSAVQQVLAAYGAGSGHVFNLGHGIWPDCPPEGVACLIDAVHDLSRAYHLAEKI